jgi:hypothetical protein
MNNEHSGTTLHQNTGNYPFKRISWSAVFVGALISVGLGFLLNLFVMALGLSLVRTTPEGVMAVAGGGYWSLLIGTVAIMFTSGWAGGYLGRPYCPERNLGMLYGFTVWSVGLILMILFASGMNRHVMTYADSITKSNFSQTTKQSANTQSERTSTPTLNAPSLTDNGMMDANVQQNNISNNPYGNSVVNPNAQQATNKIGALSLLIFSLFFVGALATCYGGYYGMTTHKYDRRSW